MQIMVNSKLAQSTNHLRMWTSSADEASDGCLGDAMKNSGFVMILRSRPFSDDRDLRSWPSSDVFDLRSLAEDDGRLFDSIVESISDESLTKRCERAPSGFLAVRFCFFFFFFFF